MKSGVLLSISLLFFMLIIAGCKEGAVGGSLGRTQTSTLTKTTEKAAGLVNYGDLVIDSKVLDSSLFVDENYQIVLTAQNTPFVIKGSKFNTGVHTVEIKKDGYETFSRTVTLRPRDVTVVNAELKPLITTKKPETILVIIEKSVYSGLTSELAVYREDIKKELGFDVFVKVYDPNKEDLRSIKEFIKQNNAKNKLNGVLLIGDIPTGVFLNPEIPPSQTTYSEGLSIRDCIYQDVYDECSYLGKEDIDRYIEKNSDIYDREKITGYMGDWNIIDDSNDNCCRNQVLEPFWVSRITPRSSAQDDLDLIRLYFRRNHEYRTGQYSYDQKIFLYTPANFKDTTALKGLIEYMGMYNVSNSRLIGNDSHTIRQYLTELSKPYEYLFVNAHGSPLLHQSGGDYVYSSDINNVGAFFLEFQSCSVGRYNVDNYLAGRYLFNGNALIVDAPDTPIFGTGEINSLKLLLLTRGKTVYESQQIMGSNSASNYFGDLTLRMRYNPVEIQYKETDPKIEIDKSSLTFLSEDEPIILKIKNMGGSPLTAYMHWISYKEKDKRRSSLGVYTHSSVNRGMQPNQEEDITIYVDDINETSTRGEFFIISNDPVNPIIKIPFEIKRQ